MLLTCLRHVNSFCFKDCVLVYTVIGLYLVVYLNTVLLGDSDGGMVESLNL